MGVRTDIGPTRSSSGPTDVKDVGSPSLLVIWN
jgi:hypothetical protein